MHDVWISGAERAPGYLLLKRRGKLQRILDLLDGAKLGRPTPRRGRSGWIVRGNCWQPLTPPNGTN